MSNELETKQPILPAVPAQHTELSPWREAVNEEQGASFGTLLKFVKGEWLIGEQQSSIGPTALFIANLDEYWRGWVRWENKEPTNHAIGRVIDRHRVHLREELGDLDQNCWETDSNGIKRDPWQRVTYLVMRNVENDEIITFTSTSDGGRKAVAKLADRFDRLRHKHPAKMPVVTLTSESYQHKEFGKVLKPKFLLMGWDFWDTEAANDPGGTEQARRAADFGGDEVPH